MCGIIGVFNLDENPDVPEEAVRRGMVRMRLRGPDAEGCFVGPGFALGHRRLKIIDLAGGAQPMTDQPTGVAIVFNGEIYNYRELRSRLEGLGHRFTGVSDTEVLLRSYLEWDVTCLERLSGIFAFAIHDPRHERMFLARDRVGVKPLFYSIVGSRLAFSSSLPALRCFPWIEPTLDLESVSHYLSTGRVTFGRRTLLKGIFALGPGERMVAERGCPDPAPSRYWDFPMLAPAEKQDPGLDAAARRVRELMADSVREQLVSDVPLGGFLSGGLDSSIIAALAHRAASGCYDAYAIGYDRDGYNEWEYVREAARFHGMRCREVHLEESTYPATWHWLIEHNGLPCVTSNEIPLYHLAKELKRDFTVALSGEGADEFFGGYIRSHFSAYDFDRARRAPPKPGEVWSPVDEAIQRLYGRAHFLGITDHYLSLHTWIPTRHKPHLFQPDIWHGLRADTAIFEFYEDWFKRLDRCSTFDAYMHTHARLNLESLLLRMDSSSMAASVEARVPFTDHRLAEYVFSLPDHYKIDWRSPAAGEQAAAMNAAEIEQAGLLESKRLLRRAFAADVPKSILTRPKMSFPVPVAEWFASELLETAREILNSSPLRRSLFKDKTLQYYLNSTAYQESAMALWPVVNLCLWQSLCGVRLP